MEEFQLTALSGVDGRYSRKCEALKEFLSEHGLIKYRVFVEIEWLKYLAKIEDIKVCVPALNWYFCIQGSKSIRVKSQIFRKSG